MLRGVVAVLAVILLVSSTIILTGVGNPDRGSPLAPSEEAEVADVPDVQPVRWYTWALTQSGSVGTPNPITWMAGSFSCSVYGSHQPAACGIRAPVDADRIELAFDLESHPVSADPVDARVGLRNAQTGDIHWADDDGFLVLEAEEVDLSAEWRFRAHLPGVRTTYTVGGQAVIYAPTMEPLSPPAWLAGHVEHKLTKSWCSNGCQITLDAEGVASLGADEGFQLRLTHDDGSEVTLDEMETQVLPSGTWSAEPTAAPVDATWVLNVRT